MKHDESMSSVKSIAPVKSHAGTFMPWSDILGTDRRMLYLTEAGLESLYKFPHTPELQCALLSRNRINSFVQLGRALNLKFLDLSDNCIEILPMNDFWVNLQQLQVLNLHRNRIQKVSSWAGIAGLNRLRVLTAHSNPSSTHPAYRTTLELLCHGKLLSLDGIICECVKVDQIKVQLWQSRFIRFAKRFSYSVEEPCIQLRTTTYDEVMEFYHSYVSDLHRLVARRQPIVLIQSVLRGHFGRKLFRMRSRIITVAVTKIQRYMVRSWVQRHLVQYLADVEQEDERGECAIPSGIFGQVTGEWVCKGELYFLPGDFVRIVHLLQFCREKMFKESDLPTLSLSEFSAFRTHLSRKAVRGPLATGLIARRARDAKARSDPSMRLKCWLSEKQRKSFFSIRRRGYKSGSPEILRFSCARERSLNVDLKPGECNRILVLRFKSKKSYLALVRILIALSVRSEIHQQLCFLSSQSIHRLSAATTLQSWGRAWYQRRKMIPSIGTAVLIIRAAILLERWWRWRLLKFRIGCLAIVKARLSRTTSSSAFIFASQLKRGLDKSCVLQSCFPGISAGFGFDSAGALWLLPSSKKNLDQATRSALPLWINLTIPTSLRIQSAKVDELIQVGCRVESLTLQEIGVIFAKDGSGHIPRRFIKSGILVFKISFASHLELKRRLALLILNTSRPRFRNPNALSAASEVREQLFATVIQTCFRGFLSRRWMRSRRLAFGAEEAEPLGNSVANTNDYLEHCELSAVSDHTQAMSLDMRASILSEQDLQDGCLMISAVRPGALPETEIEHSRRMAALRYSEKSLTSTIMLNRRHDMIQLQVRRQKTKELMSSQRAADAVDTTLQLKPLLILNRKSLKHDLLAPNARETPHPKVERSKKLTLWRQKQVYDAQISNRSEAESEKPTSDGQAAYFEHFPRSELKSRGQLSRLEEYQFAHDFMCKATFAAERTDYIFDRRSENVWSIQRQSDVESRRLVRHNERELRQKSLEDRLDALRREVQEGKSTYSTKLEQLRTQSSAENHRKYLETRARTSHSVDQRLKCRTASPSGKARVMQEHKFENSGFFLRSGSSSRDMALPVLNVNRLWVDEVFDALAENTPSAPTGLHHSRVHHSQSLLRRRILEVESRSRTAAASRND